MLNANLFWSVIHKTVHRRLIYYTEQRVYIETYDGLMTKDTLLLRAWVELLMIS